MRQVSEIEADFLKDSNGNEEGERGRGGEVHEETQPN